MTQTRRKALKANDVKVWKDIVLKYFNHYEKFIAVGTISEKIIGLL